MKKSLLAVVLLSVSGIASAANWSANGFRMIQIGNSTQVTTIAVKQDAFSSKDLCEAFLDEQAGLVPSPFKTPAGQDTKTTVFARCDLVRE